MLILPSPARVDAPQPVAAPQPIRGTVSKGQPGGTVNTLPQKLTNLGYSSPKMCQRAGTQSTWLVLYLGP